MAADARYIRPTTADAIFNNLVGKLTRLGVSVMGSRELAVRGRKSGEIRKVPVNLLTIDGERYLVAPRGNAQWVRNMRAAGGGELRVGRRVEVFTVEELADEAKPAILRAYLKKWAWEVGRFFENVDANSSDERIAEIAPGFPVFRLR